MPGTTTPTALLEVLVAAGVRHPERDLAELRAHSKHDEDLAALVARRAQRVPLEHLLGRSSFRGLDLEVGVGVFTPQPETAALVDWVVQQLRDVAAPVVVDLCCGCGTVALAVARELPRAVVHAVERDPQAAAYARRNAARLGGGRVHVHESDAASALQELDGRVDLVASNPPYVAVDEAHIPDPEVVVHDPGLALWAGQDGLDVIRVVERAARRLLRPGGLLAIEHSDRQGLTAPALLRASGMWERVEDLRDADNRDRVVTARLLGAASH